MAALQHKKETGEPATPKEMRRIKLLTKWLDKDMENDGQTYGQYVREG
jgi:hypothetical protein